MISQRIGPPRGEAIASTGALACLDSLLFSLPRLVVPVRPHAIPGRMIIRREMELAVRNSG